MKQKGLKNLRMIVKRAQKEFNVNQTESGRSMVEMLGVLAVVGVLSIGGIAGYTMAMNRHRANELMDGASKRAIVVMQQLSLGTSLGQIDLTEFSDNSTPGGEFTTDVLAIEDGEFGIKVNNVRGPVCETLVNMANENVSIAKIISESEVSDLIASDCSSTDSENTLAFVFKADAATGSGASDDDDDDDETSRYYWCESGMVWRGPDSDEVTSCECNGNGYAEYSSDAEAIAALCSDSSSSAYYWCESGMVWRGPGSDEVTSCECNGSGGGDYSSDSDAIAALCSSSSDERHYMCLSGSVWRYDDGGILTAVSSCSDCNAGDGYYYSDSQAIAALCNDSVDSEPTNYWCASGYVFRGPLGTAEDNLGACDGGCKNEWTEGTYSSDTDAISNLCN